MTRPTPPPPPATSVRRPPTKNEPRLSRREGRGRRRPRRSPLPGTRGLKTRARRAARGRPLGLAPCRARGAGGHTAWGGDLQHAETSTNIYGHGDMNRRGMWGRARIYHRILDRFPSGCAWVMVAPGAVQVLPSRFVTLHMQMRHGTSTATKPSILLHGSRGAGAGSWCSAVVLLLPMSRFWACCEKSYVHNPSRHLLRVSGGGPVSNDHQKAPRRRVFFSPRIDCAGSVSPLSDQLIEEGRLPDEAIPNHSLSDSLELTTWTRR